MRMTLTGVLTLLALSMTWTPSRATVVTGRITDTSGVGIADCDLDFIDSDTGVKATVANDTSDALGFYAVDVPDGEWIVAFDPAQGDPHVARLVPGFVLSGTARELNAQLQPGFLITGRVVDEVGSPVVLADVDAADAASGVKLRTPNDDTDLAGDFEISVSGGSFTFEFAAPQGTPLVATRVGPFLISADLDLGEITLPPGWVLTGRIEDARGVGIPAVDLDISQSDTLSPVPQRDDDTDTGGAFVVTVPSGTFDLDIEPPRGRRDLPLLLEGIQVDADVDLGAISLAEGWLVSGRTVGPEGASVAGVDIDAETSQDRIRVQLASDDSLADGSFEVAVPPGSFNMDFGPPVSTGLQASTRRDVLVEADVDLGDVTLVAGHTLSGRVVTRSGGGVADVDLDIRMTGSRMKLPLEDDVTDQEGRFRVVVPEGSLTLSLEALPDARLAPLDVEVVALTDRDIGDLVLEDGFLLSGRVVDRSGLPLSSVDLDAYLSGTQAEVKLGSGDSTDDSGSFAVVVEPEALDLRWSAAIGERLVTLVQADLPISSDMDLGDIVLTDGWLLTGRVVTEAGIPIPDVNLDVTTGPEARPLPLVGDDSDPDGFFAVVLPPGVHELLLAPPDGLGLSAKTISDLVVAADVPLGDVVLTVSADFDADGIDDGTDNCVLFANPEQIDSTGDGVGDVCEFAWGDGAPRGQPDGNVNVSDVIVALRVAVGADEPSDAEIRIFNVSPANPVPGGPPNLVRPTLLRPWSIDVTDVVVLLRAAVGVVDLDTPY